MEIDRGVAEAGVGVPRGAREMDVEESDPEEGGGESSEGEERIWTTRGMDLLPPGPHRPSSTSSSVVSDLEGELETSGATEEAMDASRTSASLSKTAATTIC